MRRLLNREEAPPQDGDGFSFRYVFPEDAFVARASSYNDWEQAIKEHAQGNGLPMPDMAVCEDQLCGTLPPERCKYEAGDPAPILSGFSFLDVVEWIKSIAKTVTGEGYVSQVEADRRAAICVSCPYNTQASGGCGACAQTARALTPGMLSRHTDFDNKLKNCSCCKCYLRIMVHVPLTALGGHDIAKRPDWCWVK